MKRAALLSALLIAALAGTAGAAPPPARSISSSKQFVVYCTDHLLRARVANFAEEVKTDLLALLDESDRPNGRMPIIISLERASTPAAAVNPVQLRFVETPEGSKITIDVQIGEDPAAINLQKHIARAVLLEYAYRPSGGIKGGEEYREAPWWLVEGAIQTFRQRDRGAETDFFRQLITTNKLPPIQEFLALQANDVGKTAEAIDAICAMCLVQLLTEQPSGKANLARMLRKWPESGGDSAAALAAHFPGLKEAGSLQKWWTLNLARLAAADRFKGLSAAETDRALAELLQFEVAIDKKGTKKPFTIEQAEEFTKLPGNKAAMEQLRTSLVALSTRGNALLRPVIAEYSTLALQLQRGKTRGVTARLAGIQEYRGAVLHRMTEIGDYLNWFEATQFGTRSDAFDGYLKVAREISAAEARRENPISQYLDQLQQEF